MAENMNRPLAVQDLMDDVEKAAYREFWEKHRLCPFTSTMGGKLSVEITGTGLGNVFICKCNACGTTEDITNIDNW